MYGKSYQSVRKTIIEKTSRIFLIHPVYVYYPACSMVHIGRRKTGEDVKLIEPELRSLDTDLVQHCKIMQ